MSIFNTIYRKIIKVILSPESYARHIGVNLGTGNFIPDKDCWSSEPFLITVGNHVQITNGVRLFTHGGGHVARRKYPDFDTFGKIVINDWVYIGNNALIMPGVTIGEGSLVAAGSVVTQSVPNSVVVGGNPARVICSIDEYIERNMKYNTNLKNYSHKYKLEQLKNMADELFISK